MMGAASEDTVGAMGYSGSRMNLVIVVVTFANTNAIAL